MTLDLKKTICDMLILQGFRIISRIVWNDVIKMANEALVTYE